MTFRGRLEAGRALSLLREVRDGERRFICYTDFSEDLWHIAATDGVDVWRLSLSEQELRDLAGDAGEASFLSDVSRCLEAGEVQLLRTASHLTLCLKTALQPLELNMCELSAAHRRQQLQGLVFNLWTCLDTARSQLADCQKQVEEARQEKQGEQPVCVDVNLRGSRPAAAARPKRPAGASLVNPSLKRRKAVKGVVFGDSQDSS